MKTKEEKRNIINRKMVEQMIMKVLNGIQRLLFIIFALTYVGSVIYLLQFQSDKMITSALDLLIAIMSLAIIIMPRIFKKMNDRQKYIYREIAYMLLICMVLVGAMIIGSQFVCAGEIGRLISVICLFIAFWEEMHEVAKHNIEMDSKFVADQMAKMNQGESNLKNEMTYKNLKGTVEYSKEDNCFFGKIVDIGSLILYEGDTKEALKKNFEEAVDNYLIDCERIERN